MFAGAAREAVFARPEVVARLQRDFVGVALKAGLVQNPPPGPEGALYREIARSRPAPQGIALLHGDGRVLCWALSFDGDGDVLGFLEHGRKLWGAEQGAEPAPIQRFASYPSRPMPDVPAAAQPPPAPATHAEGERCPARLLPPPGTLQVAVVGRALDAEGTPLATTLRQEHYAEDRFDLPAHLQRDLVAVAAGAPADSQVPVPRAAARALVGQAYLGMLDVRPLDSPVPEAREDVHALELFAERVEGGTDGETLLRITGKSDVTATTADGGRSDGARIRQEVRLDWRGWVRIRGAQIEELVLLAEGQERLLWNPRGPSREVPEVARLPAGRRIDFRGPVLFGMHGVPAEETDPDAAQAPEPGIATRIQERMERLQRAVRRAGGPDSLPEAARDLLSQLRPLMQARKLGEAQRLLDRLLEMVEGQAPR